MSTRIALRAFEERDYARMAAVAAAIDPERNRDPEWYRQRDDRWNPALLRLRLVAEGPGGVLVGWGEVSHGWWAYHPRKFHLRLNVDPPFQRQGIGSALYTQLLTQVEANWSPLRIEAQTRETRPHSITFLEHRGFAEAHRQWEAVLDVTQAHLERAADAEAHLRAQGLVVATLAEERLYRGEHYLRDVFDLEQRTYRDEPGYDPEGSMQFEQFVANELDERTAVDDGSFVALDGTRLVGISRLQRDTRVATRLHVGFTGVEPEYRGRGIALALKLRTIAYARAHGFQEIRTENDSTNAPMLHINQEIGFELEPAWIGFVKHF